MPVWAEPVVPEQHADEQGQDNLRSGDVPAEIAEPHQGEQTAGQGRSHRRLRCVTGRL